MLPATPVNRSGQEVFVVIVVGEVILGPAVSAQGRTVSQLLDVVQTAGDAAITVGIEGVEVDRCPPDDAGVQFRGVQDVLLVGIDDTGLRGAVGVHEVAVLVGFIALAVFVTVAERRLQVFQCRDGLGIALQLRLAFLVGGLDGSLDLRS